MGVWFKIARGLLPSYCSVSRPPATPLITILLVASNVYARHRVFTEAEPTCRGTMPTRPHETTRDKATPNPHPTHAYFHPAPPSGFERRTLPPGRPSAVSCVVKTRVRMQVWKFIHINLVFDTFATLNHPKVSQPAISSCRRWLGALSVG